MTYFQTPNQRSTSWAPTHTARTPNIHQHATIAQASKPASTGTFSSSVMGAQPSQRSC